MILSDLQRFLRERRRVSVAEMVCRFDADPAAIEGMLQLFVRKGRVRRIEGGTCGGCFRCGDNVAEIYEWVE